MRRSSVRFRQAAPPAAAPSTRTGPLRRFGSRSRSAAARRRSRLGGPGCVATAGRAVAGVAAEGRAVGQHRVDLPPLSAGGVLHPELLLLRVAAGRAALVDRRQALGGEAGLLGVDLLDGADLDAEVVERAALPRVLQQDQLHRRVGDGEVGVTGPGLGRLGTEQRGVEGGGGLDVVDVEGELDAGHGAPRSYWTFIESPWRRACRRL